MHHLCTQTSTAAAAAVLIGSAAVDLRDVAAGQRVGVLWHSDKTEYFGKVQGHGIDQVLIVYGDGYHEWNSKHDMQKDVSEGSPAAPSRASCLPRPALCSSLALRAHHSHLNTTTLLTSAPPPLSSPLTPPPLLLCSSAPLLLCSSAARLLGSSAPLLLGSFAPRLFGSSCSSAPLLLLLLLLLTSSTSSPPPSPPLFLHLLGLLNSFTSFISSPPHLSAR